MCGALKEVISRFGTSLTDSEALHMVKLVDRKGNGSIDFEDFRRLFTEVRVCYV